MKSIMDKLLIFAGTYEGRVLCEFLSENKIEATASVATEYGEEIIQNLDGIKVIQGRMNLEEIKELIILENYTKIIDATHPYAVIVSENIQKACMLAKREYIRLLREESSYEGLITVENIGQAVEILNKLQGNILLTTGSKDLEKYKEVSDFEQRVFARVLPSKEVVQSCQDLGIKGRNLICMQGPFSKNLNVAMLKEYDCKVLVTKNTGDVGGFREKIAAAKEANAKVIVVKRPEDKKMELLPYNLEQVKSMLAKNNNISIEKATNKSIIDISSDKNCAPNLRYFPAFVDSVDKIAVIVGAGEIGLGRVEKLKEFKFQLKVIAEKFVYKPKGVNCIEKTFDHSDIDGAFLVVAATDNRDVNKDIALLCKERGILCSVADKGNEGSFIFPAIIRNENSLIAVSSDGVNPRATKILAKKLRGMLV